MDTRLHVTLIISTELIDLSGLDLENQHEVTDLIVEEVGLESDARGHMLVLKSLPGQTLTNSEIVFRGIGNTQSVAITDWLRSVCSSTLYDPLRNRRKRKIEKKAKERVIMMAFGNLIYNIPDCAKPEFQFRLPVVGEKVLVQHGFKTTGIGRVKTVIPDSIDEKVIITIQGEQSNFDVAYTFKENFSHWTCVAGRHKIDSGSSFALYPKDDNRSPTTFLMICPPTEAARKMAMEMLENMQNHN
jgi:hypothetical protein